MALLNRFFFSRPSVTFIEIYGTIYAENSYIRRVFALLEFRTSADACERGYIKVIFNCTVDFWLFVCSLLIIDPWKFSKWLYIYIFLFYILFFKLLAFNFFREPWFWYFFYPFFLYLPLSFGNSDLKIFKVTVCIFSSFLYLLFILCIILYIFFFSLFSL